MCTGKQLLLILLQHYEMNLHYFLTQVQLTIRIMLSTPDRIVTTCNHLIDYQKNHYGLQTYGITVVYFSEKIQGVAIK